MKYVALNSMLYGFRLCLEIDRDLSEADCDFLKEQSEKFLASQQRELAKLRRAQSEAEITQLLKG